MPGGTVDELIKQGLLPDTYEGADEFEDIGQGEGEEEPEDFIAGDPASDPSLMRNVSEGTIFDIVTNEIQDLLHQWGKDNGETSGIMDGVLYNPTTHAALEAFIQRQLVNANALEDNVRRVFGAEGEAKLASGEMIQGTSAWYTTAEGINNIVERAWSTIFGSLGEQPSMVKKGPTGPRKPTAQEIRNRFDIDQLAEQAQMIWRGKLLDDMVDPQKMARAFVEAIVATRGEKVIDFATYVEKRARNTARYASIYRDKPEGQSDEQFLQPYFQAAQQVLRPGNAAGTAIYGAQFGASAGQFGEMLAQSNEVKTSAPYIQELSSRMEALRSVFKG